MALTANALIFLPIIVLLRYFYVNSGQNVVKAMNWSTKEWTTSGRLLVDDEVIRLSRRSAEDHQWFNQTLDRILVPRVSDTESIRVVGKHIADTMRSLDWTVELDTFTDQTPHGPKRFTNILATLDPKACRRLVLSCHYDSKLSASGRFVGAIDSAVPCAMMLDIAKSLDRYLKAHRHSSVSHTTIQMIFFDGEEAFVEWTDKDSLYGSRHLANTMNSKKFLTTREESQKCGHLTDMDSEIDRIEVMVLLDLLGAKNPTFYSHFSDTQSLYSRIIKIERKLNDLKLMESSRRTNYFQTSRSFYGGIDDDHRPFQERGVPILHIIATPFPSVWHKDSDNKKNIDNPTVNNLLKIFKIFVAQYLNLDLDKH
ncbi:glutaminyl-peptide cyclotransferase-like [Oppia nitens]|uniref:glutaminyl-peptide cyclotransferase-like n=1 Tax=Oppia nitens TaxID=1686743 RepID=UPI0023D9E461|nr:glutaminyl-peptide cyclotransferase-like [Oppia nitens]